MAGVFHGNILSRTILEPFYVLNSPVGMAEDNSATSPVELELAQNYPNPFNPATTISYRLPHSGLVVLEVYDLKGRKVATLVREKQDAGIYHVRFDGSEFASGVYVYRLLTDGFSDSKKLVLIR